MSSTYGERFRLTIFGQSHAPAIGVTMEGLPAGIEVDEAKLQAFLERRAPGRSLTATSRKEPDQVEFLAGLVGGRTCGAPSRPSSATPTPAPRTTTISATVPVPATPTTPLK